MEDEPDDATQENDESARKASLIANILVSEKEQREQKQDETEREQQDNEDTEKKQKTAKMITNGMLMGANTGAGALDSTGVGFLLSFPVHLASLIKLFAVDMVYGIYIAKRKSKFIPPLSYAPIPLLDKLDKYAIFYQSILIAAVFALALASIALGAGGACFLIDFVQFSEKPISTTIAAVSGGEGMCLGGIISLILGL